MGGHRIFTIEITSAGAWGGIHEASPFSGDPLDAIIDVLRHHLSYPRRSLQAYDEDNDPEGAYEGWSRLLISIDGRYDDDGVWRRVGEDPPTPTDQLAEVKHG